MRKFFYSRLALTNIKNNSKTYVPYIIACIGTIMMFYNMCFLYLNKSTQNVSLKAMLYFGTIVVGIFALILLFYTNSFLIKRRKKEFGLFNILGMEKKHIAKIMLCENVFISTLCLVLGLLLGILFSKLMILILFKILRFNISYGFEISTTAIAATLAVFIGIFILTLLNNLRHIHFSKPIELLHGGNIGEKEPKTKWLITLIGVICLGVAYYLAIVIKTPLEAIPTFFAAVLLVIAGTYCLFMAGSITLLKALRKNKGYYYKPKNFTAVSGMIYRMKQNAVGLSNICILSTIVLVMVSTTVCMYMGVDDALNTRFSSDMTVTSRYKPNSEIDRSGILEKTKNTIFQQNRNISKLNDCSYLEFSLARSENTFIAKDNMYNSDNSRFCFVSANDYEHMTGKKADISGDEVLVFNRNEEMSKTLKLFDKEFMIKEQLNDFPDVSNVVEWLKLHYVVVSDDSIINDLFNKQLLAYGDDASSLVYEIKLDIDGNFDEKLACANAVADVNKIKIDTVTKDENGNDVKSYYYASEVDSKQMSSKNFYEMYGGLLFLGIFLGLLFIMATVLIMYYKQISEGYDDKERFAIMKKVGMSHDEIKASIKSQVLMVFFLPLMLAGLHIVMAFKLITRLLALFNLTNVVLFAWCCVGTMVVFAIVYAIIYALTARTYYKIVE